MRNWATDKKHGIFSRLKNVRSEASPNRALLIKRFWPIIVFVLWAIISVLLVQAAFDMRLTIRHYNMATSDISGEIRIVMLSDLHAASFGDGQSNLIQAIVNAEPDVVVLVGDMCDEVSDRKLLTDLLDGITGRYPCYYVTGNHEYWTNDIHAIFELLSEYDLTILKGKRR